MTLLILCLEALLAPLIALVYVLSFLFSSRRGLLKTLKKDLPERLGRIPPEGRAALAKKRIIWLHAASAGEVNGIAPLAARLGGGPDAALLVTSTNPAGREAARTLPGVAWAQLAPLDAWPCVARFLAAARPARLVVSETELWPSTLLLASRAGLRPSLINARLTPRGLARARWIKPLLRAALTALDSVGAQTEEDLRRLEALGLPKGRGRVTGNTKYDAALSPTRADAAAAVLDKLGWSGAALFVAGSTHPGEEDAVLRAYLAARRSAPGLKLVLAPRHLERLRESEKGLAPTGLRAVLWSRATGPPGAPKEADVLLVDVMGVLSALYARALAAFVGGTLVSVGGHNLLEPALCGVPVLFGPHTEHIAEAARRLEEGGGGRRVADAAALARELSRLAADPAQARALGQKASAAASALRGATERTLALAELI